jgi:glyoxylase-like metal-dependent hydrolase (beta-lactamase superfamily II)
LSKSGLIRTTFFSESNKEQPVLTIHEPAERLETRQPTPVIDDVAYLCTVMVNVYFVGPPKAADRGWVLVDAGMTGSADQIARAAEARFGPGSRPAAIILTHGHFDHVGALEFLARRWDVPIYAHPMELPFLTGRSSYPPPDPSVGGGLIAALSWSFPRDPIDLGDLVKPLPEDGSVPGLSGWRWVFTPGHTPGHVALFRDGDRTLIAGDAVVTTKQESASAVIARRRELHGPPMYFTPDWVSAARSVATLAALEPAVIATGHGEPLRGDVMKTDLADLARDFRNRAVPRNGRYVDRAAIADESGIVSIPPELSDLLPELILRGRTAVFVGEYLGEDAVKK